jgi:hypothetical protein
MASPDTLHRLRRILLVVLVCGLAGSAADLVALGHYEDGWQLVPLGVLGAALLTIGWHVVSGFQKGVGVLRGLMAVCLLAGLAGFAFHYQSNYEFQLEMDATQSAWAAFTKVIRAQAPPALAPLSMTLLALIGWTYTYRFEERHHD